MGKRVIIFWRPGGPTRAVRRRGDVIGDVENSEDGGAGDSRDGEPVTNSSREGPELRRSLKVVWRRGEVWSESVGEGAAVAKEREGRWDGRGWVIGGAYRQRSLDAFGAIA